MSDSSWGPPDAGSAWQQGPTGQQQYYAAPARPTGGAGYASWIQRVLAYLVDAVVPLPALILVFAGLGLGISGMETTTDPTTGVTTTEGGNVVGFVVMALGYLIAIAVSLWNVVFRQGRTGWSIGKQVMGIRLLKEQTGQPMGAGLCFVRGIAHILDALPCYLGYLWPLWDAKRQTFADKVMTTVVVEQRKP